MRCTTMILMFTWLVKSSTIQIKVIEIKNMDIRQIVYILVNVFLFTEVICLIRTYTRGFIMIQIKLLTKETAQRYQKFTYQSYRPWLVGDLLDPYGKLAEPIAFGAEFMGKEVGLIVGKLTPTHGGEILSIFVEKNVRNMGIGTYLMQSFVQYMRERGQHNVHIGYYSLSHISALERCLEKVGFAQPTLSYRYYLFPIKKLVDHSKWLKYAFIPREYELVCFTDVDKEQLKELDQLQEEKYAPFFHPLANEEKIVASCSYFLKTGNDIVGWSIVEQNKPDTLFYRTIYIREKYRNDRLGLALAAQTALSASKLDVPYGLGQVGALNEQSLKLVNKLVVPYCEKITEYKTADFSLVTYNV